MLVTGRRLVPSLILESLSSTSDTNTDTNNKSCASAVLAKSQMRSVLEVATTEVRAILLVVGIERQTYINPVFYSFFDNFSIRYRLSHVLVGILAQLPFCIQHIFANNVFVLKLYLLYSS